jgi:3-methyladenine DNA glycosylase/8-oxoguanine DNA glycosylase
MNFTLPARQPFSLATVVTSHGWVQLAPFTGPDAENGFDYVLELASGRVVCFHVSAAEKGVSVSLTTALTEAERTEVEQAVSWMVGLDMDFSDFYAAARQEPKLAHVAERAQGRLLRAATLFENVVKVILTTNTTWGGTKRMALELTNTFGAALSDDPRRRAFPTPARLAEAELETLQKTARLGYRAPYVLELAQRVAGGELDLESWKTAVPDASSASTEELRKRLLAIKGIGPYAAASLLMLMGHYDSVPVDSWAFKLVSYEWYDRQPVGRAEVEKAFADWGQWQGLAYWFWDWAYHHSLLDGSQQPENP